VGIDRAGLVQAFRDAAAAEARAFAK
jgi:hypothetical protein